MRQFERFSSDTTISFSVFQNRASGQGILKNISLSGGFIESRQIPPPNTWVTLKFSHDSIGTIQTAARSLREDKRGFSIHFAWTDRTALSSLRDFLTTLGGTRDPGRKSPEDPTEESSLDQPIDSLIRKTWASFVRNSSGSLLNTMISWCHSAFFYDAEETENPEETFFQGSSPSIADVYRKIRIFAPTSLPVLLMGETGTGKEVFSRTIHHYSAQKEGPFVPVNCGAIPESLAESLLFGHEKGSFTGAIAQQKGYLESAADGTLFLDEIGDLPLPLQVKLLRVLQERVFNRIGSHVQIPLKCRIVTATNKDLKEEVRKGTFRQDLFYRLEGVAISIPPLRERTDDLLPLAQFLVQKISRKMGLIAKALSPEAERLIQSHPWKGNVRELGNALHRAVIVSRHIEILPEDLGIASSSFVKEPSGSLRERRERHEKEILSACLLRHGGNVGKIADELGISRPSVYNMIKKFALDLPNS
ncbi:sigma-54-dependent Fis family transcriptional regulator [Leptospirillum ferriphilum]|uniref:Fis family transcriptional regulator n=2 Tax=Leptospirillum ferriphilum TaxID=178606 RepID=A0A059XNR5_9BACT|nr:sigma-54-dependent Fis family transcriptional regulator [Leptospirillum ferriphilum]AIA30169.1 Fis family transcriptional regulator [Leptospirillum ferriphilum YSK]OOH80366.1 hypothetical protein BOX30_05960 [Leptospirillum ferriphilum]